MWTKFGVVIFASAMLLVMEVSSDGFVNRLLKTTKSPGNNEGSARDKPAVGLFAHLASVVYRPLAKARRSASSMMRSTNSSSGSDDDDSIAFVEKATRLKVAKMQRSKQQQQSNRLSSLEGERRNYVPSDNNNLYLHPDETSETHPEIRHHGKPPPLFTRQDRQQDEASSTFFDSRETPPHLQHFHEHLLNLIQSVPAAAADDAPPRSRSSDVHGVEVDRTGDSKAGYVRFPSSDSTDPSHPSSHVRGGENKQNNKNNPQAHQHVLGSNNPGGKISKYLQYSSSNKKHAGQSLKKLSDASFDDDDTSISNEDNNEETNNDSGYSGGSQQQLFNPASYDDGDQQHSFFSAGPASVLSNIDVQIDVAPAGPSFNEEHNPLHNFDGDDDDDGHADYPHQNPHELDHVSGNHQPHFDGHHLQHSSIGPIAGSNSGSGITIPNDADVSINVGPSSLPAHSSYGPGPQVPLTYPKHGGGKHGVFLPNHIFDSALSGIAVLAFLSFLANRLGQGFLAGGRRRRKRSIFATSNHDGAAADESFIYSPYSSNDLPPQHLKVIFPKNYTDNAVDGRFQPLQYAVVYDGDVQWLLQSFGLRDL